MLPQGEQAMLELADEMLPAIQCEVFLFSAGIIVCCIHWGLWCRAAGGASTV